MIIEEITLYHLSLPFVSPFRFSHGELKSHDCLIVAVKSDGLTGWGECPVFPNPCYTYETLKTASHILTDFLIPQILGKNLTSPSHCFAFWGNIRGHNMAKAGVECALWDLFAKSENLPLYKLLGGKRQRIPVGVSISLQDSLSGLLEVVESYLSMGYRRVKLKISPDFCLLPLQTIRHRYPNLLLMADANCTFTLDDINLFLALEELNLLMIEQPFAYNDILDHAKLQSLIKTPVCLDESINSPHDTRIAILLQAARAINLKVSRVGGITNALAIHHLCQEAGIKLWCGGMLESGIGRAINLHIASLPNFVFPADISASSRYFAQDIITQPFVLNSDDSTIDVPQGIGIGVEVDWDCFSRFVVSQQTFS